MENKVEWQKPDYENRWSRVTEKEIDRMCIEGTTSFGDVRVEKEIHGRKVIFTVFRVEKEGELIRGIETLTRQQLIEEIRKLSKNEPKNLREYVLGEGELKFAKEGEKEQ